MSGVERDELSPDIQLKINLRAVKNLGLETDARLENDSIVGSDVYADVEKGMHSAFKRDNMPAWLRLIERARTDEKVGAVVAYDLSRVFRNIGAMLEETKLLNSFGVNLILNGKIVNLQDPHEWAMWVDQAKHAEFESRITSWRLLGHYQELRDLGIYFSHSAPFGLTRKGSKHKVVWETNEDFFVVETMFRLFASGKYSHENLAEEMNRMGLYWRNKQKEKVRLQTRTVQEALFRMDRYKPFIDPILYAEVEREKQRRSKGSPKIRNFVTARSLLQSLCYCAVCGSPFYVSHRSQNPKAHARKDYYFHKIGMFCRERPTLVGAPELEQQFYYWFDEWRAELEAHQDEIIAYLMKPNQDLARNENGIQREALKKKLRNLEEMRADGEISKARFLEMKKQVEDQLAKLDPEKKEEPQGVPRGMSEAQARAFFSNITKSLYERMDNASLRKLVKRIEIRHAHIVNVEWWLTARM
jgi:hypothetical protein